MKKNAKKDPLKISKNKMASSKMNNVLSKTPNSEVPAIVNSGVSRTGNSSVSKTENSNVELKVPSLKLRREGEWFYVVR